MTDTLFRAQLNPAANALTDLYVCGTTGSSAPLGAVTSEIVICNQDPAATASVRLSVAPLGAADTVSQYLLYDVVIQPNDTFHWEVGVAMATTDKIRVQSDNPNVSFSVFGVELS